MPSTEIVRKDRSRPIVSHSADQLHDISAFSFALRETDPINGGELGGASKKRLPGSRLECHFRFVGFFYLTTFLRLLFWYSKTFFLTFKNGPNLHQ